jgi:N-methylhydantoinase A/oxoprolinase/acetone carboxylase beta subunit
MSLYLLGVDTGGTYTDAAILDGDSRQVIASAKSLTTKGNLAVGVTNAIRSAIGNLPVSISPQQIALISVSTTLATNAVVEGDGAAIAAVLIGFDVDMIERTGIAKAFPSLPIISVAGGHDHNGNEKAPLDIEAIAHGVGQHPVGAVAIASSFAVRNPTHEHQARDLIVAKTGLPVTISTELSSDLDAPRRALTTVLNARLVSRVTALIDAVETSMHELQLDCPLLVVKGDGTLALADSVAKRPIETVLSGPAASLVGAGWLSGLHNFIVADMGGTTTDLGYVVDGRPKTNPKGAEVGGWRTTVKAIDVRTIGLGGDSEVRYEPSAFKPASSLREHPHWPVSVGPRRIIPISLLAHRFPEVLHDLQVDVADPEISALHGAFLVRPFESDTTVTTELTDRERELYDAVSDVPVSARKVLRLAGAQRSLQRLQRLGLLNFSAFTPSDAAHVLALQNNWCVEAAMASAKLQVRFLQMRPATASAVTSFASAVWSETVRRSAREVLHVAMAQSEAATTKESHSPVNEAMLDAVCGEANGVIGAVTIRIAPSVPIVAVGGPVKVFYPEVAMRLGAEVVFPPFWDVANAVGAATATIARKSVIAIEGVGDGVLRVHGGSEVVIALSPADALARAEALARDSAQREVIEMGGVVTDVHIAIEKRLLPGATDDAGLFSAVVTAEAVGYPRARLCEASVEGHT